MSEKKIVTKQELKDLIRTEGIKPEDLFSPEQLKPLLDKAKNEGYAEGRLKSAWEQDKQEPKPEPEPEEKNYCDPQQNPFIKTD